MGNDEQNRLRLETNAKLGMAQCRRCGTTQHLRDLVRMVEDLGPVPGAPGVLEGRTLTVCRDTAWCTKAMALGTEIIPIPLPPDPAKAGLYSAEWAAIDAAALKEKERMRLAELEARAARDRGWSAAATSRGGRRRFQ